MRKVKTISISIDPQLVDFVDKLAEQEHMSRSSIIARWIRNKEILFQLEVKEDGKEQ